GRRAVGKVEAVRSQVPGKFVEAVHREREMREVGLNLPRAAAGKTGNLNLLLTARCFEKNQFRAARRFVPTHFLQPEDVAVKCHRAFEIVHAVTRMQEFCDYAHARNLAGILTGGNRENGGGKLFPGPLSL